MLINPFMQGKLYVLSLLCGLALGGAWDVTLVWRVLTGACPKSPRLAPLYRRPLPLIGRAVGFSDNSVGRTWQAVSLAFWQMLFPVFGAITVLLLSFGYNNGVFRLPVLLLLIVGFVLWRRFISARIKTVAQVLAFLLHALFLYLRVILCFPLRIFCRSFYRFAVLPLRALFTRYRRKHRQTRSQRLCAAQLAAVAAGQVFLKQTLKRKRKFKLCQIKKEGAASRP